MEEAEYNAIVKAEKERSELTLKQIARDFALSNNPYKEGDIIKDHLITIKIKYIRFQCGFLGYLPSCVYYGEILNKNGSIRKTKEIGIIYQNNIK